MELKLKLQLARVEEPFDLLDIHDSTAPWAILKLVRSAAFNCAMLTPLRPTSPSLQDPLLLHSICMHNILKIYAKN